MLWHKIQGAGGVGDAASAATYAVYASYGSSSNTSGSRTFSSINIGTASSDRIVVLQADSRGARISTCTIGGIAATLAVRGADSESWNDLWYAVVPTGTTATITFTHTGGTSSGLYFAVYAIYGATNSTPYYTANTTNTGLTPLVIEPELNKADGATIAIANIANTNAWSFAGSDYVVEHRDYATESSDIRVGIAVGIGSGRVQANVTTSRTYIKTLSVAHWR